MSAYVYLIIATGCFIGELFTMEFSLSCLGVGLLVAALCSALGFGLWVQVICFCVASTLCWLNIRPLLLRYLDRFTKHVNTPAEDVIGKEAVVETAIDPVKQTGRVKVLGESWKATAATPLKVGEKCVVEKLDGVTLTVRPNKEEAK